MEDDNLEGIDFIGKLYYLIQKTPSSSLKKELDTLSSFTQNPKLLKKWIDFLIKLSSIMGQTELDMHAEQFGYNSEENLNKSSITSFEAQDESLQKDFDPSTLHHS